LVCAALRQGTRFPIEVAAEEVHLDAIERRGDQVVDEALKWLSRNSMCPFFVWVHLYDPHAPYHPPEPFASHYPSRPYDGEIWIW